MALDLDLRPVIDAIASTKGRSKFRNVFTVVAGESFHSKREAARFQALQILAKADRIRNLKRQVKYRLEVNGLLIATYTADFTYDESSGGAWHPIVEDVKGYPNDRWPMKKKLMRACHGIEVRET